MKRQAKSYWCGVASVANALEVLGVRRSQKEINRLCHVTPGKGTSEVEMKRALLANGMAVDEWQNTDSELSLEWLYDSLQEHPVILCVDNDDHYVTAIGLCGSRVLVFDPSRNAGLTVYSAAELSVRWRDELEETYYGLGVSKR